jgi:hypothetical protein
MAFRLEPELSTRHRRGFRLGFVPGVVGDRVCAVGCQPQEQVCLMGW